MPCSPGTCGSLRKASLKPAGEWNHYAVIANDNGIYVVLNGKLVNFMNLDPWTPGPLDPWTEAGKKPGGSQNKFKTACKEIARRGPAGLVPNVRIRPIQ
jgi:hypothetical protein